MTQVTCDKTQRMFDCEASLTDRQVLAFCRDGFLILDGIVSESANQRTCAYLNGELAPDPNWVPDGMSRDEVTRIANSHEPSTIMLEDWFCQDVLLNKQVAGAVRSLLGRHVGLPVLVSKHSPSCPAEAGSWHHDADCVFGPELNYLEAFYYPQNTPAELGPTEIAPGTHIGPSRRNPEDSGVVTAASAGSIVLHVQTVLHRKSPSTASGVRHMLKYNYWRSVPPRRNWIIEPDFDLQRADYGGHGTARYCAHMFYWLCGKGDEFRVIGGQAWPFTTQHQIGPSYGFARRSGYLPNWRRNNPDNYTR